jgi:hypothetical protein
MVQKYPEFAEEAQKVYELSKAYTGQDGKPLYNNFDEFYASTEGLQDLYAYVQKYSDDKMLKIALLQRIEGLQADGETFVGGEGADRPDISFENNNLGEYVLKYLAQYTGGEIVLNDEGDMT